MSRSQEARLRAVLLDPDEAQKLTVVGSDVAGVLVPLFERGGNLHAIFTKRRADLRLHAGQISFPGGRRDRADADLVQTALREAHEEIGLDPALVTLVGALAPTPTIISDIAIYPVVGLIPAPTGDWIVATREVEAVIEAPLAELATTHRLQVIERADGSHVTTDAYTAGADTIWGATARIATDLLVRLAAQTD